MLSLNNGTSAAFNAIKWCQRFIYVMRIDHEFFFRGRRIAVPLFVAGAIFREIWVDSWSAKHFFCIQKCVAEEGKVALRAVLQFHGRIMIMFESSASENKLQPYFGKFLSYFGLSMFRASAIFGDVGG